MSSQSIYPSICIDIQYHANTSLYHRKTIGKTDEQIVSFGVIKLLYEESETISSVLI